MMKMKILRQYWSLKQRGVCVSDFLLENFVAFFTKKIGIFWDFFGEIWFFFFPSVSLTNLLILEKKIPSFLYHQVEKRPWYMCMFFLFFLPHIIYLLYYIFQNQICLTTTPPPLG